jgi:hypothetical protein
MMSKSEGGIGLEQGVYDIDHLATLIHFFQNQNSGVVLNSDSQNERIPNF